MILASKNKSTFQNSDFQNFIFEIKHTKSSLKTKQKRFFKIHRITFSNYQTKQKIKIRSQQRQVQPIKMLCLCLLTSQFRKSAFQNFEISKCGISTS